MIAIFMGPAAAVRIKSRERKSRLNSFHVENVQGEVQPVESGVRHNFCDRAESVLNGSIPLADGLDDMVVSVLVHFETDPFYFNIDNETFLPKGGLMYTINNELAARGDFVFNYTVVPFDETLTVEEEILYHTNYSDLSAQKWHSDKSARRLLGTGFTQVCITPLLTIAAFQPIVFACYCCSLDSYYTFFNTYGECSP